jgi:hypothetical protein
MGRKDEAELEGERDGYKEKGLNERTAVSYSVFSLSLQRH